MIDPLFVGILGASLVLTGFILNIVRVLDTDSLIYVFLNFFGSVILVMYAFMTNTIPFIILNTVWTIFSGYDLYLILKDKHHERKNKKSKDCKV